MFPYLRQTRGTVSNEERRSAEKNYSESVRREHRQQEDSTAYMKNAKHYKG